MARAPSSAESVSSIVSTSSQRLGGGSGGNQHEYATTASVTTSYSRYLSDACAVVLHCPKHQRFALVPSPSHRGLWLPYVTIRQSEGWYAAIVRKLRQLLGVKIGVKSGTVFTQPEIMHVMRIQLPEVLKYVTRVVFMTNLQSVSNVSSPSSANSLSKNKSSDQFGNNTRAAHPCRCFCEAKELYNGMRWLKHETIVGEEEGLEIWGPEPGIFTSAFATNTVERGAYSEYTLREATRFQPSDSPKSLQEEMLKSCHFERSDILRLYSDYVQHCYPSQNMNFVSFRDYMRNFGFTTVTGSTGNRETSTGSAAGQSLKSTRSDSLTGQLAEGATGSGIDAANASQHMVRHDVRGLYRAFKYNKAPYLTFHELLLGLAAMDRSTAHGGHSGELRCGYIFRYYDSNSDGFLSIPDVKAIAVDTLRRQNAKLLKAELSISNKGKSQQQQQQQSNNSQRSISSKSSQKVVSVTSANGVPYKLDAQTISREVERIYVSVGIKPGEPIPELQFIMAVGSMQLRGTSALFRSHTSVLPIRQHYEIISERHALTDIEGNLLGTEIQRKGTCPRCKDKRYVLALHTVKLTHDSQIVEPTEVRFDEYPPPITRAQRQLSRAIFASESTPNKLIDMITTYWNSVAHAQYQSNIANNQQASALPVRFYSATTNAVELGKTNWERIDRQVLAEDIRRLCAQVDLIFKREARVVGVTSPCIVLGDIHGNLIDLRTYERILWPHAPTSVAGSYLFLGDYVDRGDYGLECIVYLLAMKVLAPRTFFLLRGNHELRAIQQAFTFYREVCDKFRNQQLGQLVWETLNKTFDLMPIAATIDDQIYCAHGGIPTSAIRLDELANIPTPLQDPESQSAPAWEILWNDPVSTTEYTEYADLLRKQPGGQQAVANMQGYLPNTKRGTAFFFSEDAVKRFLNLNNLTHIIRAHECVPPGYAMMCNGRVMTLFSSSHYCGATNDAACVLVEKEKIRVIRLETD